MCETADKSIVGLLIFQQWTDVKLTSPQLSRESMYKLSLKHLTLQCVSARQDLKDISRFTASFSSISIS